MKPTASNNQEFRLGITMAGAISAGCYTGGVMDYLFEILEIWQQAKEGTSEEYKEFKSIIPPHSVIIEAMGGASAGGMTTTMAAIYALNGKINPVREPGERDTPKGNIFYDSWVLMDDVNTEVPGNTFAKLWNCDDLKEGMHSFLNSDFVDRIAAGVFPKSGSDGKPADIKTKVSKMPTYISHDLEMILSHTLLRGLPLSVDFQTPIARFGRKSVIPNHTTYEHYAVSHYHLNKGTLPDKKYYHFLNPFDEVSAKNMLLSTIATGAFPLGLRYRKFDQEHLYPDYLKSIYKRILHGDFGRADPDPGNTTILKNMPKDFTSVTVDGGAINNEPYREVMSILNNRYGPTAAGAMPGYGVIMIDPFPDRAQDEKNYNEPKDLLDVVPDILNTLQHQSRIKRREMLENDLDSHYRSIIFPRKWQCIGNKKIPEADPIACASVGAFGGFLDMGFREHDFFLGRDNARNFFRYFFSMPYDLENGVIHPIHSHWTPEMVTAFGIEKDGKTFLPIIPDLTQLREDPAEREARIYSYTVAQKPQIDPAFLFESRKAIQKRLLRIFALLKQRDYTSGKEKDSIQLNRHMERYYKKNVFTRLSGWFGGKFLNLVYYIGRGAAARSLTKKIISTVISDLEARKLLTEVPKNK